MWLTLALRLVTLAFLPFLNRAFIFTALGTSRLRVVDTESGPEADPLSFL
jgi:hypothetical protein